MAGKRQGRGPRKPSAYNLFMKSKFHTYSGSPNERVAKIGAAWRKLKQQKGRGFKEMIGSAVRGTSKLVGYADKAANFANKIGAPKSLLKAAQWAQDNAQKANALALKAQLAVGSGYGRKGKYRASNMGRGYDQWQLKGGSMRGQKGKGFLDVIKKVGGVALPLAAQGLSMI